MLVKEKRRWEIKKKNDTEKEENKHNRQRRKKIIRRIKMALVRE